MFYVYILKSEPTGSLYIGYTSNLEKRIDYHNRGLNKSTRYKRPWKMVYTEEYKTKQDTLKRERFLKKQRNRQFYNKLIQNRGE